MDVRPAEEHEIERLAKLWYDGWRDAHLQIVPEGLTRVRTLENFRSRMQEFLPDVWVIGPPGAPVGFYYLKNDELDQFYVAAEARGTGVAAVLMRDAEARLEQRGIQTACLACAIGNERAARFYEKCGWHRAGIVIDHIETSGAVFDLEVWRYEKSLSAPRAGASPLPDLFYCSFPSGASHPS